jgi:hypothetical protein
MLSTVSFISVYLITISQLHTHVMSNMTMPRGVNNEVDNDGVAYLSGRTKQNHEIFTEDNQRQVREWNTGTAMKKFSSTYSLCETYDFHCGDKSDNVLLGLDAAWTCCQKPMIRELVLSPSLRLKTAIARFSEMLVSTNQSTRQLNPKEHHQILPCSTRIL